MNGHVPPELLQELLGKPVRALNPEELNLLSKMRSHKPVSRDAMLLP
jgi:hypothetical protein